jgi:tetratricopeptide (TPR) repeat protein
MLVFAVPPDLERLAAEIDGWLDLRCPDKALALLQPLLDRKEARSEGLALRIRAHVATRQHDLALRDLQELRATDYDPEWLDLTEAWCRKRTADLPGAVRCMEQLLARNARSAIGHYNLGCYLALIGERERAVDEVTLACGIDPSLRELLHDEPDLDTLARDARFRQLLAAPPAAPDDDLHTDVADHDDDLEAVDDDDEPEAGEDEPAGDQPKGRPAADPPPTVHQAASRPPAGPWHRPQPAPLTRERSATESSQVTSGIAPCHVAQPSSR